MAGILTSSGITRGLEKLHADWALDDTGIQIQRTFVFKNYYECMAFTNAVAWVAHQQNHHPDMLITYKTCHVVYSTHSAGGLTSKDFESAGEADRLIAHE